MPDDRNARPAEPRSPERNQQRRLTKIAILVNRFVHDFASGYWLACVLVIALLRSKQRLMASSDVLGEVARSFFYHAVAAVVVVLVTGGVRSATYVPGEHGGDVERPRRVILIVKHVVLFAVFGVGTYWAYRASHAF